MKILFLIRSLDYGGAQRQLVNLSKSLRAKGYDVSVCIYYSGGPLDNELQEAGVRLYRLEKKHRWDVFSFFRSLIQFVLKEHPDMIHAYLSTANVISILLKPFLPGISVIWGVRASNMDLSRYDWFWRFSYFLERKLSRFADLIIVNSFSGMAYSARNGFPGEKMIVIPNGIETNEFRPQPQLREKIRREWGVEKHETLIGLAARLDPKKDHPNFIKAASRVIATRKDVRFVCVGRHDDSHHERLHRLAKEHGLSGRILWAGSRKDMPAVYNGLDILCLSSAFGEGFPNVIGEAMACGVPCVATDVGDSARIVGDTGIIVPPKQPEDLAEGLKKMIAWIETEKDIVTSRTRERVVEMFGVEKMVSSTETVLIDIVQ